MSAVPYTSGFLFRFAVFFLSNLKSYYREALYLYIFKLNYLLSSNKDHNNKYRMSLRWNSEVFQSFIKNCWGWNSNPRGGILPLEVDLYSTSGGGIPPPEVELHTCVARYLVDMFFQIVPCWKLKFQSVHWSCLWEQLLATLRSLCTVPNKHQSKTNRAILIYNLSY